MRGPSRLSLCTLVSLALLLLSHAWQASPVCPLLSRRNCHQLIAFPYPLEGVRRYSSLGSLPLVSRLMKPQPHPTLLTPPPKIVSVVASSPRKSTFSLFRESFTQITSRKAIKWLRPMELLLLILFRFSYHPLIATGVKVYTSLSNFLSFSSSSSPSSTNTSSTPSASVLELARFTQERCTTLLELQVLLYLTRLIFAAVTAMIGIRFPASEVSSLISRVAYTLFISQTLDLSKKPFVAACLPTDISAPIPLGTTDRGSTGGGISISTVTGAPSTQSRRRQRYVAEKTLSAVIWTVSGLVVCEMISSFLRVPLSSTLAFGGVGGIALGLSARDAAANLLGGMQILLNEPFTPGDMITFRFGNADYMGRVERIGWVQTRIRGRDTRPTYIPNSHFGQLAVTNCDRITHRKFNAMLPLRFQDAPYLLSIVTTIKERLRTIPKLDALSMPLRVSLTRISPYSLDLEVSCYFATRSSDEFLNLQQLANVELLKVIHEHGAALALPTTLVKSTHDDNRLMSLGMSQNTTQLAIPHASSVPPPIHDSAPLPLVRGSGRLSRIAEVLED